MPFRVLYESNRLVVKLHKSEYNWERTANVAQLVEQRFRKP